jgi:hypothetical protein
MSASPLLARTELRHYSRSQEGEEYTLIAGPLVREPMETR